MAAFASTAVAKTGTYPMEYSQRQLFAFYEREIDRLLTLARECRDGTALRRLLRMASEYIEKLGWSTRRAKLPSRSRR